MPSFIKVLKGVKVKPFDEQLMTKEAIGIVSLKNVSYLTVDISFIKQSLSLIKGLETTVLNALSNLKQGKKADFNFVYGIEYERVIFREVNYNDCDYLQVYFQTRNILNDDKVIIKGELFHNHHLPATGIQIIGYITRDLTLRTLDIYNFRYIKEVDKVLTRFEKAFEEKSKKE